MIYKPVELKNYLNKCLQIWRYDLQRLRLKVRESSEFIPARSHTTRPENSPKTPRTLFKLKFLTSEVFHS